MGSERQHRGGKDSNGKNGKRKTSRSSASQDPEAAGSATYSPRPTQAYDIPRLTERRGFDNHFYAGFGFGSPVSGYTPEDAAELYAEKGAGIQVTSQPVAPTLTRRHAEAKLHMPRTFYTSSTASSSIHSGYHGGREYYAQSQSQSPSDGSESSFELTSVGADGTNYSAEAAWIAGMSLVA